jgi:hypothetical protein
MGARAFLLYAMTYGSVGFLFYFAWLPGFLGAALLLLPVTLLVGLVLTAPASVLMGFVVIGFQVSSFSKRIRIVGVAAAGALGGLAWSFVAPYWFTSVLQFLRYPYEAHKALGFVTSGAVAGLVAALAAEALRRHRERTE